MSEHLDKAKGAMAHARALHEENERDPTNGLFRSRVVEVGFTEAMRIAAVNAAIAQAEAIERLADVVERFRVIRVGDVAYADMRESE